MYVEYFNSAIFLVFNVVLVSYRDLNLKNTNYANFSCSRSFLENQAKKYGVMTL